MFTEQVYMLLIIYKMAYIRLKGLRCVYIFYFFGLDVVLDLGLEPDHSAEQTFRALLSVGKYYM